MQGASEPVNTRALKLKQLNGISAIFNCISYTGFSHCVLNMAQCTRPIGVHFYPVKSLEKNFSTSTIMLRN